MKCKGCVLLILLAIVAGVFASSGCSSSPAATGTGNLLRFNTYDELSDFVGRSIDSYGLGKGGEAELSLDGTLAANESAGSSQGGRSVDFSETNIQVEGVDEADIAKTDGEYIYLVSDSQVIILLAYPPELARVLSRLQCEEEPVGLFIAADKLVVLTQTWDEVTVYREDRGQSKVEWEEQRPQTTVMVYDVSNRETPVLKRSVVVDGQYCTSRMIDDYVYVVSNSWAVDSNGDVVLPKVSVDGEAAEVRASDVYYWDVEDCGYSFTNMVALNVQDDGSKVTRETFLIGASSNIYVSIENIYVTSTAWWGRVRGGEKTIVTRFEVKDGRIDCKASGEVPGCPLNQFSMDEYDGFFRVATTTSTMLEAEAFLGSPNVSGNHVYVLDMGLDVVGRLEDLAPGESIHSARFMGQRCYLVTFKQIDPFFVIDLGNPYAPRVLGELKITGYSDYLHPYGPDHVIGIGKEAVADEEFDGAWHQGVKVSLFDVSDVANPVEVAKHVLGDRGSGTPVLRDHKALLFDASRNLLVMPVLIAEVNGSGYPGSISPQQYGEPVWQGACVFHVSVEDGLTLQGKITHYDSEALTGGEDYLFGSAYSITRSLFIDDVLYTVSEEKVSMNSLQDLSFLGEVGLQA